jgi:hypothetical protein
MYLHLLDSAVRPSVMFNYRLLHRSCLQSKPRDDMQTHRQVQNQPVHPCARTAEVKAHSISIEIVRLYEEYKGEGKLLRSQVTQQSSTPQPQTSTPLSHHKIVHQ